MNATGLVSPTTVHTNETQPNTFHKDSQAGIGQKYQGSKINAMLPWDKFSQWVSSILVVTFDIEMGQSLESIYPSMLHAKLTHNEKLNICYMSFPDSNSGFLGDTQYHFRYSLNGAHLDNPSLNRQNDLFATTNNDMSNKKIHSYLTNNSTHENYNRKTFSGLEGKIINSYRNSFSTFNAFGDIFNCHSITHSLPFLTFSMLPSL
jgi:hypothetical protein